MSDNLLMEVRDARTSSGLGDDKSIMLRLQNSLDELCDRLEVARLSDFYDRFPQDTGERLLPDINLRQPDRSESEPHWFNPNPALTTVRALVTHLESCPDASQQQWPEQLIDELRGCEAELTEAVSRGRQFRLLLS